MREGYQQNGFFQSVSTVLGPDVLLLDTLQGTECISALYQFSLTMRSSSADIKAKTLIGKPATVTLQQGEGCNRYISGIISRFSYLGGNADFSLYTAELVPSFWLLTLGRRRVIYQNWTAPEIISKVLREFDIQFKLSLTQTYRKREYCVRYDESAFDFVSRLMEEEGIFYFFVHENGRHTLIMADSNTAFEACPHAGTMVMRSPSRNLGDVNAVVRLEQSERLVVQSHTVDDYNYLTPSTDLLVKGADGPSAGVYEYPGRYTTLEDGELIADIRAEEHQASSQVSLGESHCPHLVPGTKFELQDHPRDEFNTDYVIRRVQHFADKGEYQNTFETFSTEVPFRPPRVTPRPVVLGNHTAVVVGPGGEEIWTDQYGRIKVQFPWDRLGAKDEKSSCWIRVSQAWAGQGWGALFLPRIGQEVIVSYLDGDPDRPLVIGSVYNAEQTTPIELSSNPTQSTLRSRSTKNGQAGNEIRFEDKTGEEELYLHAQKDMWTEVENNLKTEVIEGDELHVVKKGNRSVQVQTGNEEHVVQGTRDLEVGGNETHVNKADMTQQVTGNYTLEVGGDYALKVTGNLVIEALGSVTIQSKQSVDVKAGTSLTNEANLELVNKGKTKISNESVMIESKATGMHTLKAGGSLQAESSGILMLKGTLVKIN